MNHGVHSQKHASLLLNKATAASIVAHAKSTTPQCSKPLNFGAQSVTASSSPLCEALAAALVAILQVHKGEEFFTCAPNNGSIEALSNGPLTNALFEEACMMALLSGDDKQALMNEAPNKAHGTLERGT